MEFSAVTIAIIAFGVIVLIGIIYLYFRINSVEGRIDELAAPPSYHTPPPKRRKVQHNTPPPAPRKAAPTEPLPGMSLPPIFSSLLGTVMAGGGMGQPASEESRVEVVDDEDIDITEELNQQPRHVEVAQS